MILGRVGASYYQKKCAEKFFRSIDDAQCHPIEIQDSEGKDWNFRLRMWPNNKSKMYVLEGFEPYVKSMKLAEGDTVTFSRLVPDGKLVIGNRKGMVIPAPSKQVSKGKRTSTTRNPNVVIGIQSDLVTAKVNVGSKRKTCEIGLTGKSTEKNKRAPEVVDSPRGSNVPSNVVEKGFERRSNKLLEFESICFKAETLRTSTGKPGPKCKTKSTTGNLNTSISTIEPMKGNLEPESSEPVETEVTDMENVATLPVPPKWIKKHPRHRSACTCAVCKQAASGSKHHSSCQSPSHHTGSSNTMRVEPRSSNRNSKTTTSVSSKDNQNLNSVSGSDSKILSFDLNLPPETNEEFLDTMSLVQETSSGGGEM
ncbi:hypothetical protein L1987_45462 [Smallanthus sonchifolius]|uniref:Uncharacterized protein n=1 Tax=Smallanthus sonchifolius TaxID=185202 RepID=A0ACB9FWV2_9ASTR|nr:hypothetical protein L1987_45462 [Smallanthus sonchifolius]